MSFAKTHGIALVVGVHIERGGEPNTTRSGVIDPSSDGAWIAEHIVGAPAA